MDPAQALELEVMSLQEPMKRAALRGDSEIQQFYENSAVFVTGGTGFMGKLLIEKLLRVCKVRKIYLLIRQKKGKSIQERLDTLLEDPVFNLLRESDKRFSEKIELIEGDSSELRLGLSQRDWTAIAEEVGIIFHLAATTKFDESLRLSTLINVRGTREVLHLAKACIKLRSYVHVSTAYSHATRDKIGTDVMEQFYPSPVSPGALIQLVESTKESRLNAITDKLTDGWPNNYTFTKAVSEELVRQMARDLPVCVVRPSTVTCAYYDPAPGWVDMSCVFGATGIFLNSIMGVSHVSLNNKAKLSLVPADYVNNALLAAGGENVKRRQDEDKTIKIYTLSSSRISTFSYAGVCRLVGSKRGRELASPKAINYIFLLETSNVFIHWLLTWLLHYIPSYLLDTGYNLLRIRRPYKITSFTAVYKKIYKVSIVLSYFGLNEWNLRDDNTSAMYNSLSPTDKDLFNFDIRSVDFEQLVLTWGIGIRKYIIKDGLKNTAYGVKKQQCLKVATFTFLLIYVFVFILISYLLYISVKSYLYNMGYLIISE